MKHLKTFESYTDDLNEGILSNVRKWSTGYESSEERDEKIARISKQLDEIEAEVKKNPEKWNFDRSYIEQKAKENNYLGEIRTQKGGRYKGIIYVVWDNGATGLQDIAGAASVVTNRPTNKQSMRFKKD